MFNLTLAEAKSKRKVIKATVIRLKGFVESTEDAQLSRFNVMERMKRLSMLWDQFDEFQTRIEMLSVVDDDENLLTN